MPSGKRYQIPAPPLVMNEKPKRQRTRKPTVDQRRWALSAADPGGRQSVLLRLVEDGEYSDALARLLVLIAEPKRAKLIEFMVNNRIV